MKISISKFAFWALITGLFLTLNQTTRAQSTIDDFNPQANDEILTMAVQSDGKILVGGYFFSFAGQPSIGGQPRNRVARLNSDGMADSTFNPDANDLVRAFAIQPDGKIIVGGNFTLMGGQTRNRIARLNFDGTLDAAFNPNANDQVTSLAIQADGKILVGGRFTAIGGQTRNRIARLNLDGTADATFNPNADSEVQTLAVQSDGKILAGGFFNNIGGQSRKAIARLNPDGTLDTAFNANADNAVFAIAIQQDGKIIVGGFFTIIGSIQRNNVARLNSDGTLDSTFNPNANSTVFALAIQPDSRILVGGAFTMMGGLTRNRIARLNPDGTLDSAFNSSVGGGSPVVRTLAIQSDGKILLAGRFANVDGQTRSNIARLNPVASCSYSLSPTTAAVGATGGSGSFTVTVSGGTNCTVTAQSNNSWLTTSVVSNGSGTSTVTYTFLTNNTTNPRSGTISVGGQTFTVNQAAGTNNAKTNFDFDGDRKADLAVFRPSSGIWYILRSQTNGFYGFHFGQSGDQIAPADYDGDGKTDVAVFRGTVPGAGNLAYFYILNSSDNSFRPVQLGITGDVPLSGDWDGDGKGDLAVYRAAPTAGGQSFFYYRPSSQPTVNFNTIPLGTAGDKPLLGDFDGDGRLDPAVFRPSTATWIILKSSVNQITQTTFGLSTDIPVPADYDGDGQANIAVFRPSNGTWYTSQNPATNYGAIQFGANGDLPVPADYDGDGKTDVAVFRNGTWYLQRSQAGFTGVAFGSAGDRPAPNAFIP